MFIKKYHRLLGLIMLIPLCLWALTGAFFLIKPGYDDAYQKLYIKTYPLAPSTQLTTPSLAANQVQWHQFKWLRTTLGNHLLVDSGEGWQHIDPITLTANPEPSPEQIKQLINDATTFDKGRYGQVETIAISDAAINVHTNTGVHIVLDWNQLSLSQRGPDTEFISSLYKVHYLQWTNSDTLNTLLAIVGLGFLIFLTVMGGWMSFKKS